MELALKLKEQGRAQPRGLLLFSPWTDMTASGKSYRTCKTLDPMLTMEYIAAVREAYTGPDGPARVTARCLPTCAACRPCLCRWAQTKF